MVADHQRMWGYNNVYLFQEFLNLSSQGDITKIRLNLIVDI